MTLSPAQLIAQDIEAGFDLFQTEPGSTYVDLAPNPIPPDFFGPGSDPFDGQINLEGAPPDSSDTCPNDDVSHVDTIVRRLTDAHLPNIPSQATVPIEIVSLQLQSIAPITVTYNGGQNPELWDLYMDLSPILPTQGQMLIRRLNPEGGLFNSFLLVYPRFIFTRLQDQEVRILDMGETEFGMLFVAVDVPWVHWTPPEGSCTRNFCSNPGGITQYLGQFGAHGVISICPTDGTPVESVTWGQVRSIYR